jgi:RNA polymerase sigma-54 factor
MLQAHYQALRPLTTAHLAQTMTLLALTADELRQQIDAELASNPALELVEERRCPTCKRLLPSHGPCPVCSRPKANALDEPIVFISPRDDFYSGKGVPKEDLPEDNFSPAIEDLPTYVLRQIASELDAPDRPIAAYLLTHLDEDGLLTIPLIEVARYHHIPLSRVESIVHMIQRADPIGVGSSSPTEALLVQLEVLAELHPVPAKTEEVIRSQMDLLSRHQYAEIARALKIPFRQVQEIARFIGENLNPFPGRTHWGDQRQPEAPPIQVYHQPDIIISHLNDRKDNPLVIEIIMPISGTLRINPLFRQAIRQASEGKIDEWKADLERASLFVKCLQQRNNTMQRLMSRIAKEQADFILYGEAHLKPFTRAQLAEELGVHESTISRAVANKAVQLPSGRMIPLAKFFDRSLSVRTVLRQIIEKENRPLSDTDLTFLLAKEGYHVARRTVAKYRAMEGILPAHLRKARIENKA